MPGWSTGQRAFQVGEDSKWVVIASGGLQRAAANVGAGGMLKKNLPVSMPATSAILPASFLCSGKHKDSYLYVTASLVVRAVLIKQLSCACVALCILDSLSAYITFKGCLTKFWPEMSACYTLCWLIHISTCRTSTSAGVQQWCCRCAWEMKGWPWRAASEVGSRMKCCAVCVSWSTSVSWLWK